MALTQKTILAADGDQKLADGGGLYLFVRKGRKRWVYIFQRKGRRREMGLGGFPDVSLAEARRKHLEARAMVLRGDDPLKPQIVDEAFGPFAQGVMEDRKQHWRSTETEKSWKQSLKHLSKLDRILLEEVETEDILRVLKPIWTKYPETAHLVRMRAETVFDHAIAKGLRRGANPARWKGHLEQLLPKPQKLVRGHFSALPYAEAPAFMRDLEKIPSVAAYAIRFVVLTAARGKMVRGARWSEIEDDIFTVPAERMKHGREFVIPLSDQVRALLKEIPRINDWVFPSFRADHVSASSMTELTKPYGCTVHGFRSTFKDWASEKTDHGWETSEHALAHQVGDMTSRAYRRGTSFEKRRQLMQDWADFLSTKS